MRDLQLTKNTESQSLLADKAGILLSDQELQAARLGVLWFEWSIQPCCTSCESKSIFEMYQFDLYSSSHQSILSAPALAN